MPSWAMAETKARSLYRKELAKRMKRLREASGRSQSEMARVLGVTWEAYKKQEQRGALPTDKLETFAALVNAPVAYVLTGTGPTTPAITPAPPARRRA